MACLGGRATGQRWRLLKILGVLLVSVLILITIVLLATHHWRGADGRMHLMLTEQDVANKSVLVVGDVHGCMDELMQLLNQSGVLDAGGRLREDALVIAAGDLINKGPASLDVLAFVRSHTNFLAVTGNHELNVLQSLREGDTERYPWSTELTPDDRKWLRGLPWTISLPQPSPVAMVTVVHAGLLPGRPLHLQDEFTMTRMRNLDTGDTPVEDWSGAGVAWASLWRGPQHVIFGHDAHRGRDSHGQRHVQRYPNATGLDTRCVKGGWLTGLRLPEHDVISVKCRKWYHD